MLACKFDVRIDFNTPLTILSAVFAILFTFAASLSNDYWKMEFFRRWMRWVVNLVGQLWNGQRNHRDYQPLVGLPRDRGSISLEPNACQGSRDRVSRTFSSSSSTTIRARNGLGSPESTELCEIEYDISAPTHVGWKSWLARQYEQITVYHFLRAVVLAAAIDSMFYIAMLAMEIDEGYLEWHFARIVESYLVTLLLCIGACLAMVDMELHIGRQMLVATLSAASVCSMHYFGERSSRYVWSYIQRVLCIFDSQEWKPQRCGHARQANQARDFQIT